MESYLSQRKMKVRVDNDVSKSMAVTSGVPQGSIVGPTLFIAYINSLTETAMHSDSDMILYADDLVIVHPLHNVNSLALLQEDVNKISISTLNLGLKFNVGKCQLMVASLSKSESVTLSLNGENLRQVACYRYLGVDIEEKLNFATQTNRASTNMKRGIGVMNRLLRKWAPTSVLSTAIQSIVMPVLLYGIEVWYPPNTGHQIQIEKSQKFALRLITNDFKQETTYSNLLSRLKWTPIYRVVAERRLLNIKRYIDGLRYIPDDVFQLSTTNQPITRQSARLKEMGKKHSLNLLVSRENKNLLEEKLVAAVTRTMWNALDEETVRARYSEYEAIVKSASLFQSLIDRKIIPAPPEI
jgi:hypothetical protein